MPDTPILVLVGTKAQFIKTAPVLREFDDQGVRLIWVETPPADASWDGVRDRLQRAAAG